MRLLLITAILLILSGCQRAGSDFDPQAPPKQLFTLLPDAYTGVDFENTITYTESYNPYTFRNFFNGGGVGLGDINNDGLLDVFLSGNLVDNKLYLNKGNFQFEDITQKAGIASPGVWSTGVSFVDINGDGWLDIYLCKSGSPEGKNRNNELFINNGDLTFTEKAKDYGIADLGLSTHAAFFDYDRDGDLDLYLLNNSIRSVGGYDLIKDQRKVRDPEGGNKLYRNEGKRFTDVSEQAGIYGSNIGFGLGVTIGDVNRDSWPDIYVSNDFFERDYLYLNNRNGTFSEVLEQAMQEISLSSMGADMADLNNDGFPEIFVTDMLPPDDARIKTKTAFDNWNKYQLNLKNGYYRQFTRNVLQLNNGDGAFSEIGRLAGVFATDWSWGALIMDMDNDGRRDIFVANGILKDLTDQDYVNFYSNPDNVRQILGNQQNAIVKMVDDMPSQPVANYAFYNNGDLTFTNKAGEWGLGKPGFSNGSAYGDLDNDGDLDLVINNINDKASIYRNEASALRKGENNFLTLKLTGKAPNTRAIGAQVTLKCQGETHFAELHPMRGFQSCVDDRLHFGLGKIKQVDTLTVIWPDGKVMVRTGLPVNQTLELAQTTAVEVLAEAPGGQAPKLFTPIGENLGLDYRHLENDFSDFDRDRLIYHMLSAEGPRIATGDLNGDGREDFFIGGAKDSPGAIYLQTPDGRFSRSAQPALEADAISEDTDALFFDADGDRDLDLYVCSGGNEFPTSSTALVDRLYFNDGRANFTKSNQVLPTFNFESTSCVRACDYDRDGDQDLFVGVRLRPFLYGVPVNGYILQNDGLGNFKDVSNAIAPQLTNVGLITDAQWLDIDKDKDQDLVVVGEWMPVSVFKNEQGRFQRLTSGNGLEQSNGFWNVVKTADLDQDGDLDLVLGNQGLNTRFKASPDKPASMYINDFDRNGTAEQFVCVYNGEKSYPMVLLHDLVKQIPALRKDYLKYESYQGKTMEDLFSKDLLDQAVKLQAYTTQSAIALNQGDGSFKLVPLPVEAQFAPIYGLLVQDLDGDKLPDILTGGNFFRAKPETGIYAASYGLLLKGDGKGHFTPVPARESGFKMTGEIRDLKLIRAGKNKLVLVARNDEQMLGFIVK